MSTHNNDRKTLELISRTLSHINTDDMTDSELKICRLLIEQEYGVFDENGCYIDSCVKS